MSAPDREHWSRASRSRSPLSHIRVLRGMWASCPERSYTERSSF